MSMQLPDGLAETLSEEFGEDAFEKLMWDAQYLLGDPSQLRTAFNETTKLLIEGCEGAGIFFPGYTPENVDSTDVHELYDNVVSKITWRSLHADGINNTISTILWSPFMFPYVGLAKGAAHLGSYGWKKLGEARDRYARNVWDSEVKRPSKKYLLKLKEAADHFKCAHENQTRYGDVGE
jgi:hypothetical protein